MKEMLGLTDTKDLTLDFTVRDIDIFVIRCNEIIERTNMLIGLMETFVRRPCTTICELISESMAFSSHIGKEFFEVGMDTRAVMSAVRAFLWCGGSIGTKRFLKSLNKGIVTARLFGFVKL